MAVFDRYVKLIGLQNIRYLVDAVASVADQKNAAILRADIIDSGNINRNIKFACCRRATYAFRMHCRKTHQRHQSCEDHVVGRAFQQHVGQSRFETFNP